MEFFDWNMLGSYAGAVLAVSVLTQLTKDIPGVRRMPTQLWSYVLALATLFPALHFTAGLSWEGAVLALFNGALVSLSANGGYQAVERMRRDALNGGA